MAKEDISDLLKFLLPFPERVQQTALWLRNFIWDLYPDSNELIYDNYNALAFGLSTSDKAGDVFCSIAVFSKHVNFGFNRGSEIYDPEKLLSGDGVFYRYITVHDVNEFPQEQMIAFLYDAHENSLKRLKPVKKPLNGQTIVKSVSPTKRRPM